MQKIAYVIGINLVLQVLHLHGQEAILKTGEVYELGFECKEKDYYFVMNDKNYFDGDDAYICEKDIPALIELYDTDGNLVIHNVS